MIARTLFSGLDVIPQVAPTNKAQVIALQKELIAQGYDVGPTGADGVYGPNTAAAVARRNADNAQRVKDASAVADATSAYHAQEGLAPTQDTMYVPLVMPNVPAPSLADAGAAQFKAAMAAEEQRKQAAQVASAQAAVQRAQTALATARTPQQAQAAQSALDGAKEALSDAQGGSKLFGLPTWQVAVGGVGVAAIGLGLWSMFAKKGKR